MAYDTIIKSIINGPGRIDMAISLAYAFRMDNLHLVTFTCAIPGLEGGGHKERVMITSIKLLNGTPGDMKFRGRLLRFDGDITQEIEGSYNTETRNGTYYLVKSPLIADLI